MTPEAIEQLARLIREHARLQAEFKTLASILATAVEIKSVPVGWIEALKEARKEPQYRAVAEQFDAQLDEALAIADQKAIEMVLRNIPPNSLLN